MIPQSANIEHTIAYYGHLSHRLAAVAPDFAADDALRCLLTRDQIAFWQQTHGPLPFDAAQTLLAGDQALKQLGELLAGREDYARWRSTVAKDAAAWWWQFSAERPPDWYDAGITVLAVVATAISLAIVADVAPRFISGGTDIGTGIALIVQSLFVLLASGRVLTPALKRVSDPWFARHLWLRPTLIIAALLLFVGLRFFGLQPIARVYDRHGLEHYAAGRLNAARMAFNRATLLSPNDPVIQYNLASVYEDLDQIDAARRHYVQAAQAGLDLAQNNLARLYILDGDYNRAVFWLEQAINDPDNRDPQIAERTKANEQMLIGYKVQTNLAWARVMQGPPLYSQAEAALLLAERRREISVSDANIGSADTGSDVLPAIHYCLRAIIETHRRGDADELWVQCRDAARAGKPDEEMWHTMAIEQLAED